MGWRSAVAFPRRSALTIVRRASLRIRRPIASPEVRSPPLPDRERRRRRPFRFLSPSSRPPAALAIE
jgi:hypothetical protein